MIEALSSQGMIGTVPLLLPTFNLRGEACHVLYSAVPLNRDARLYGWQRRRCIRAFTQKWLMSSSRDICGQRETAQLRMNTMWRTCSIGRPMFPEAVSRRSRFPLILNSMCLIFPGASLDRPCAELSLSGAPRNMMPYHRVLSFITAQVPAI